MSFDALAWAARQRPGKSSAKLVLLAMAENTRRHEELAFASIAAISEFGDMDRKTVIAAIAHLETLGLITDTGDRVGVTKQIKVYRLNLESVPETVQFQKRNSSEKSPEQSQKRDTDQVPIKEVKKATPSQPTPVRAIGFDRWWQVYPRKIGKGAAEKAYRVACRVILPDKLLTATTAYAASRFDEDPQFTPHPATWLGQRRFEDPIEEQPIGPRNGISMGSHRQQPSGNPILDGIALALKRAGGEAAAH